MALPEPMMKRRRIARLARSRVFIFDEQTHIGADVFRHWLANTDDIVLDRPNLDDADSAINSTDAERDFFFHAPVFMTTPPFVLDQRSASSSWIRLLASPLNSLRTPHLQMLTKVMTNGDDFMTSCTTNTETFDPPRRCARALCEKVHSGLFRWLLQSRQDAIDTLQIRPKLWLGF